MPTAFIGTGSPTALTMNGACPVDGPNIGLLAFVSVVPATSVSYTTFTSRTLTYGPSNIPAISLGAIDAPGNNGWIEIFYLQGITFGAGAASKVVATMSAAVTSIGIETITYTNVSQVTPGSFVSNAFTGTSCSLNLASAVGKYVVGGFACAAAITGASAGTQRLLANSGTTGNAQNASVVDTAGAAVSTLTATTASSHAWAAVGVSIDFIVAANADHQATRDTVASALTGSSSSGTSQSGLQSAVAGHFGNTVANAVAISTLQSPAANLGLVSADIYFKNYADAGSLPGIFTATGVSGSANWGITSGQAVLDISHTGTAFEIYNVAPTTTDYQIVSAIFTAAPAPGEANYLLGRFFDMANMVMLTLGCSTGNTSGKTWLAEITCSVTGTVTQLGSSFSIPYTPGAITSFVCGMQANGLRYFQVLVNGVPQVISGGSGLYIQDAGNISLVGASYRKTAFGGSNNAVNELALPMSYFGMQDQVFPGGPPVVGPALALETTASTAPVQLTTKTDAVQAIIGSSGMAEVVLDDYSFASVASVISQMSFDVLFGAAPTFGAVNATGYTGTNPSGTHTPLSTDNYVVVPVSYTVSVSGVTYGGVAMTPLFPPTTISASNGFALYGLAITPGAGAKTVVVTGSLVCATSVSYTGVGAVGTPVLATATGTALTESFVNHPSCTILQAMSYAAVATGNTFTAHNQTQRFLKACVAGVNDALLVQDMAGIFGTVTGTATASISAVWESLMLPLMGAGSIDAASNIANGYWVGVAQPASTTGGPKCSSVQLMSGLTPGLNTFVSKYCVVGSGTGSFQYRRCTVTPK